MMRFARSFLLRNALWIGLLLLWLFLTEIQKVAPIFLPPLPRVIEALQQMIQEKDSWRHITASTLRVMAGLGLSALIALPVGVMIGLSRHWQTVLEPLNTIMRYLPVVAFIPLLILWLGIDDTQKIAVIVLGTVFPLALLIAQPVRHLPRFYHDLVATSGGNLSHYLCRIVVPSCLPQWWQDCRIACGWAWSYLTVAELVATEKGLGFQIMLAARFLQTDRIFAMLAIIGILGVLFDVIFYQLSEWWFSWQRTLPVFASKRAL